MNSATKTLKVGIIGTGYFSHFHYAAWNRMADVELVAMHALDEPTGLEFQNLYSVPSLYHDIQTLIEHDGLDVVDIVVPPSAHAQLIERCVAANLPVICQKPFCQSLSEAEELVASFPEHHTMVAIHENFRFQPWYQHAHSLLNEGLTGPLYEIRFDLRPGDGQGRNAYMDRQPYFQSQPRFVIQETGVHYIDVFRYLFGEITGVFARLAKLNPVIAGEDAALVVFEFANGARGLLNANRLSDHAANNTRLTLGEMRIEGAEGVIDLNGFGALSFRAHGNQQAKTLPFDWNDNDFGGDCVYLTNRHIADHLLHGTPLCNSAADYLVNRRIEEAIYTSADRGCWIKLDARTGS